MIALVWNCPVRLVDMTVRYELYADGLRALGEDAVAICPTGTEVGYPYLAWAVACETDLHDPGFWARSGCRAAIMITWHRMTGILRAMCAAGLSILAIGESDAQLSPRYHPYATFRFMTYLQPTWRDKLGASKHWLLRFLFRAGREQQALIENTAASDVIAFGGQGAADEFRHLIRRIGAPELADRVAWVPYPIPEMFCSGTVNLERADRVIAIGRWDSLQKNPELLGATIGRLRAAGNRTEILIVGRATEEKFAPLARGDSRVHLLGVQPRERIHDLMAGCRAVLIPSRWESGPIVANEMLALGGSVVGTPIPNLTALTADSRFGRVSRSHSAMALANAVRAEMIAWDQGERDPEAIASHWRPLPCAVARQMLNLLGLQAMASRE